MYSYSDDEEVFHGLLDTEAEAVAEAFAEYDDADVVFVGEAVQKTISSYLHQCDIEGLLENISERAYEECGEVAENWLINNFPHKPGESVQDRTARAKVWKEQERERLEPLLTAVKEVFEQWATDEKCQPGFWYIKNVRSFSRSELPLPS
jgi:hypothetical protein